MEEEKTYIIVFKSGTRQRITVPADWKVTFGPAAKGSRAGNGAETRLQMPLALRFYENKDKQRAIFTDVVSFRDASIKIEEEKIDTQEKDGFVECGGIRKRTTFQVRTKEWRNPDEVDEDTPRLPRDSEMFDIN
jgi:hypothetical protein